MEKRNLPIYNLEIDPEKGFKVYGIAYVEEGAVEEDFLYFNSEAEVDCFSSDELQETFGVALIPDKLIVRLNKKTGEKYYVRFTKDQVKSIAMQYMKDGFQGSMNLNHTKEKADSFIYQFFLINRDLGIKPPKGMNQSLPDGTLIIGTKVLDKTLWQRIKTGEFKAFSIEGLFQHIEQKMEAEFSKNNVVSEEEELINMINRLTIVINNFKK